MRDGVILILGAGINGAALARQCALAGWPVCVVDTNDLARGTTAYSSRLIHGGLRYLEYGEASLVHESLRERAKLLELAPHLVAPLRLSVPVRSLGGGLVSSARRFFGATVKTAKPRGLAAVRLGLSAYDLLSRGDGLPRHRVRRSDKASASGDGASPQIDARRYRWTAEFWDAQLASPERLVVAWLDDARRIAKETGSAFDLLTYHRAELQGDRVVVRPVADAADDATNESPSFRPAAIVNGTGAWVDATLHHLHVPSQRLIGGTKGTHLVTAWPELKRRLGSSGVYAEAADGRPVFVLPWGEWTLVGTTDEAYHGEPGAAIASSEDIAYLRDVVQRVFGLSRWEAEPEDWHYAGVRPLPYVGPETPSKITRRHFIHEHAGAPLPLYSIIGGKLTTCRSLAAEIVEALAVRLNRVPRSGVVERPLAGGENYPADVNQLMGRQIELGARMQMPLAAVASVWRLIGNRAESLLPQLSGADRNLIAGTQLPRGVVRWSIENEWPRTLEDLVERRLMLLQERRLSMATLTELAALLVETNRLAVSDAEPAVEAVIARLASHFGRRVA